MMQNWAPVARRTSAFTWRERGLLNAAVHPPTGARLTDMAEDQRLVGTQ